MSERKVIIIKTPSGLEAGMKEYITAGEFLDLNEGKEKEQLSQNEMAKRLMHAAVVSLDGSSENVPERLREIPIADYIFITKEVAKLVDGNFTEAKSQ